MMKKLLSILTRGFNAIANGVQRISIVSQAFVAVGSALFKVFKIVKELSPMQMIMVAGLAVAGGGSAVVDQMPPEMKAQLPVAIVQAADAVTDTGKVIGQVTVDMVDDVRSVVPLVDEAPDRTESRLDARIDEVTEEIQLGIENPSEVEFVTEAAIEIKGPEAALEAFEDVIDDPEVFDEFIQTDIPIGDFPDAIQSEVVEGQEKIRPQEQVETEELAEELFDPAQFAQAVTGAILTANEVEDQTAPLKAEIDRLRQDFESQDAPAPNEPDPRLDDFVKDLEQFKGTLNKLTAIDLSLIEKELPEEIDAEEFQKVAYSLKNLNVLKVKINAIEPRMDDLEESFQKLLASGGAALDDLPDSVLPEKYDDSDIIKRIEALEATPTIEVPPEFDPASITTDNISEGRGNLYYEASRVYATVISQMVRDEGPLWDDLRIKEHVRDQISTNFSSHLENNDHVSEDDIPEVVDNGSAGYIDIESLRIQWGSFLVAVDTDFPITLPAPFLNNSYSLAFAPASGFSIGDDGDGLPTPFRYTSKTATRFTFNRDDDFDGQFFVDWIAIGLRP